MFDKRLFQLTPGLGKLVAGKVALMWVGLLANIGFVLSLVMLLSNALTAVDPPLYQCDDTSPDAWPCPTPLQEVAGSSVLPMAGDIMFYVLLALLCAAVRYTTTTHATRLGTEAAERVKLALRSKLYRKMLALGPSYASRVKTSDVVQSAGEGVEQIQSFFELFLPQLFYAILAPLTLFVAIAPIDMPSALTMLLCAPLIIIVTGMVSMTAARAFKKYWGRYTDMGAAFLDNLQGLETLKNFDTDDRAAAEMDNKAENFRVMTMRVLQIQLRSLTAMDVVAYGGAAAGIGVALWRYAHARVFDSGLSMAFLADELPNPLKYVAYGLQYLLPFGIGFPLTLTGLLFIVLLSAEFFIPMRQLGSFFHVAMNGMTSTKRIFALLDAPEPAHGTAVLPAASAVDGIAVAFNHVSYSYDSASAAQNAAGQHSERAILALTDVSFTAHPGKLTAVVGVSGSGKSTAAALLAGTLTGYQGSLTLSGCEARELTGETLARNVTLIGASSHLFAGTLRDNLMMALPDNAERSDSAVSNRLWQALGQARIADFVRSQPNGLDMVIEPDAANLSGGQRQRIAIARALLHDSPVFVFDEATSSVDVESEELILATIRELAESRGKTVIMITHRMANAEHADQIVVFDHAHAVETGTHASLMAANSRYAELFTTQANIEHFADAHTAVSPSVSATPSHLERNQGQPTAAAPSDEGAPGRRPGGGETSRDENTQPTSLLEFSSVSATSDPPATHATSLTTFQTVKRLLNVAAPLTRLMVAATISGSIGHLAATFLPVFGIVAAFAIAGHPVWGMGAAPAIIGMIICALLRGITRYIEQYLNHNVAFHLLALFRSKAFAALRRLAPAKLTGKGKGNLIAMLTTDVELLEIFFAHTISPVAIAVTTTIVYAIIAATLNPYMALALIIAHLVIGVIIPKFFATGVHNLGPAIRGAAGQLDDVMLDDMRGIDEIIRFGRGEDRARAIEDRTRALWREHAKLSRVNGRFAGIGGLLVFLLNTAAIAIVLKLATAEPISIPALVTAFVLFTSSFGPTLALSALPANLTQTFAAARRLFGIMDESPAVTETGTAAPQYEGMQLNRVTFTYPNAGAEQSATALPILKDFSLDIPRHGILGVQGPSGRGKSTMLKLLMRYWDPQSGQVLFSSTPLPEINAHYRRHVQTMMSQDTHLFDGTIRDNLLIALPEAEVATVSDAHLRDALAKASVLELIDSLPNGIDTEVGELGDRLSEGERQRIGLARVFLRNADLILFDEPTSRLDALNEAIILRSIQEAAASRNTAVVLVSHRESAMRIADATLSL
ncbi:multidrug ABC superfamily ATP binding cassette transporter ATPase and permease protein [Bifidobacterium saguini DSM 23967]|uniref:Multidrug ABC superfamily ATP binding cassette transporter ATPase and permease protein n=2 Tax=Bifidobacterium saguini TaxID=762210 RepID=A0A087D8B3_9BIFI|nr:ATP-binding cassette domain-containing protein [Bifidobacterium saguini]KFI91763.1 multidrug ABC superfamily ATP binding cassette transporter ATPase and permease protein [Bifidobacterium saguini DSM 23967]QTB90221.1 ATP-binding cassette domain-containing protein [Bifidobacterium saguini]